MDTNIKISIGMNEDAAAESTAYTGINFDFFIQTQKISAITKELQEKTGKFRVPALIFDFPQSAKDVHLKIFQPEPGHTQFSTLNKGGRVYKCLDILNQDFVSTKKKFEKIFSKLTTLDNKLFLHIDLYNVDGFEQKLKEKKDHAIVVFLQKAKIQGKFLLDQKFFNVIKQCISKVSPKFAQSPIMAIIPLFGGIDCQLELDSLNQLQGKNQQELFSMVSYQDPGDDQQGLKLKKQFKNKDKVYIYFSFGELAVLKIQLQVRMFAMYRCFQ